MVFIERIKYNGNEEGGPFYRGIVEVENFIFKVII